MAIHAAIGPPLEVSEHQPASFARPTLILIPTLGILSQLEQALRTQQDETRSSRAHTSELEAALDARWSGARRTGSCEHCKQRHIPSGRFFRTPSTPESARVQSVLVHTNDNSPRYISGTDVLPPAYPLPVSAPDVGVHVVGMELASTQATCSDPGTFTPPAESQSPDVDLITNYTAELVALRSHWAAKVAAHEDTVRSLRDVVDEKDQAIAALEQRIAQLHRAHELTAEERKLALVHAPLTSLSRSQGDGDGTHATSANDPLSTYTEHTVERMTVHSPGSLCDANGIIGDTPFRLSAHDVHAVSLDEELRLLSARLDMTFSTPSQADAALLPMDASSSSCNSSADGASTADGERATTIPVGLSPPSLLRSHPPAPSLVDASTQTASSVATMGAWIRAPKLTQATVPACRTGTQQSVSGTRPAHLPSRPSMPQLSDAKISPAAPTGHSCAPVLHATDTAMSANASWSEPQTRPVTVSAGKVTRHEATIPPYPDTHIKTIDTTTPTCLLPLADSRQPSSSTSPPNPPHTSSRSRGRGNNAIPPPDTGDRRDSTASCTPLPTTSERLPFPCTISPVVPLMEARAAPVTATPAFIASRPQSQRVDRASVLRSNPFGVLAVDAEGTSRNRRRASRPPASLSTKTSVDPAVGRVAPQSSPPRRVHVAASPRADPNGSLVPAAAVMALVKLGPVAVDQLVATLAQGPPTRRNALCAALRHTLWELEASDSIMLDVRDGRVVVHARAVATTARPSRPS